MTSTKSAEAFRTISEAADELGVPQHVLRHWEDVFGQIRPMRRAGGRRFYRPVELDILRGVRTLLYEQRYTTKGVQKIFRDNGVKYVAEIGRLSALGQPIELRPLLNEEADDRTVDGAEPAIASPERDGADRASLKSQLTALLERLERIEDALDETALALESIEQQIGDAGRRHG